MKSVANTITTARILLALSLFFVEPLSPAFFVIYVLCGISDMVDGYIARKTGTASRSGEKLDSAADAIMIVVLMIRLYPCVTLTLPILIWILMIAALRAAAVTVVFIKYHTFRMIHTYANKMTGLLLFLFPFFIKVVSIDISAYILCIAATISALEEFIITLSASELNANRKSIFTR